MLFVIFPLSLSIFLSFSFVSLTAFIVKLFFLDFVDYCIPMLRKFSAIVSSNIFSDPFSLSSCSGNPIMQMLVHLTLSQRIPGKGSLVGCRLWGRTESDMTEAT